MGKGGGTIGYHYLMTLFGNLCRGPVNELVQIDVGDEMAWKGSVTDATPTAINSPDLFGGEKREGGIQGAFRLLQGADDQVLPAASTAISVGSTGPVQTAVVPDIKAAVGVPMGEMRGVLSFLFDGLVTSFSPYPKEWKFRLRRSTAGWYGGTAWYPDKAAICMTGDGVYTPIETPSLTDSSAFLLERTISEAVFDAGVTTTTLDSEIKGMNPAHIIYQALTDPLWGAGQPISSIDENSFIAAANQLCSERFGLCLRWTRQENVDRFIQVVVDHIAAAVYVDPQNGKWTLRLIRGDYDRNALPIYSFASGLLDITEEDNASGEESFNEIRVKGHDQVSDEPFEVFAQTLAALQDADAEIISNSVEYKGIPTRALALRVAERDLRPHAAGLKRFKLTFDRRAWAMTPAMPLRIQAPERGLDDIVLRVGDIDYGTPEKPQITVRAVEDSFGLADTAFGTVVAGSSVIPVTIALPSPRTMLVEANYRDVYRVIGQTEAGNLAATSAVIGQYALLPIPSVTEFDLATKAGGEVSYTYTLEQPFTVWADLAAGVGPTATALVLNNNFGIDADLIGEALHIGGPNGEIVRCEAWDTGTATLTVARGCGDTVPQEHAAASGVWALDDTHGVDGREYAEGEAVSSLVLTRTRNDLLAESDAIVETLTVEARHAKPYPPGNVTVDAVSIFALTGVNAAPVIDWAHRDRITQADQLVAFGEGSVGPEPGTTYRIRVYDPLNMVTPLRTVTALAAGPWTYDAGMQTADGALPVVVFRLDAQRDGIDSWQAHQFEVRLIAEPITFDSAVTTFDGTETWDRDAL